MNYIDERKKIEGAYLIGALNEEFREKLVTDPESALKRLGFDVPGLKIGIIQEKEGELTLVVPEDLSEGKISKLEMAMVSGGVGGLENDCLGGAIGGIVGIFSGGTKTLDQSGGGIVDTGTDASGIANDIFVKDVFNVAPVINWFAGW